METHQIKKKLKENGQSQKWLSEKLNIHANHLNAVLNGRQVLTKKLHEKINNILKIK